MIGTLIPILIDMYKYPIEVIGLPTKGWFYPKNHPFSCGTVSLKPLTGYHEDILTNVNLVKRGFALKEILESVIVNKPDNVMDLYAIDVHGILLALRILTYGPMMKLKYSCPSCENEQEISLNLLNFKSNDISESFKSEENKFYYQFIKSQDLLEYRLLTLYEDLRLPNDFTWLDTLKAITTSINSNTDRKYINNYLENELSASDSKNFKMYYKSSTPEVINKANLICQKCEHIQKTHIPINNLSILGIEPKDKASIHEEIFNLSCYSEGGFTQDIVYNLPVYLRKFYINKLIDSKKKEKEQIDNVKTENTNKPKVDKPNIPPKRR